MVDPYAWDQVGGAVGEDDFYKISHRKIFHAIQDLYVRSQPVDIITVSNYLNEHKDLEAIGGAAYLAEVMNNTPTSAHIATYAKIVKEKALLRRLIHVSGEIIEKAYGESYADVETFLDEVEGQIFSIGEKKTSGLVGAAELIKVSIDKLTELSQRPLGSVVGISSGFKNLDAMTSGFQPGEITIIAARPSMGKTAFS